MTAVVIGATGAIGAALADALAAQGDPPRRLSRTSTPPLDLLDEASIETAAAAAGAGLSLVIDATGMLHGLGSVPEKSLRALDPQAMATTFAINAIGPGAADEAFPAAPVRANAARRVRDAQRRGSAASPTTASAAGTATARPRPRSTSSSAPPPSSSRAPTRSPSAPPCTPARSRRRSPPRSPKPAWTCKHPPKPPRACSPSSMRSAPQAAAVSWTPSARSFRSDAGVSSERAAYRKSQRPHPSGRSRSVYRTFNQAQPAPAPAPPCDHRLGMATAAHPRTAPTRSRSRS